jgi:hypothetical protein
MPKSLKNNTEYLVLELSTDNLVDVLNFETPKAIATYKKEHPEHYLQLSESLHEEEHIEED